MIHFPTPFSLDKKQIPLTQNKFALVDASDYDYLNQWKWHAWFNKNSNTFYAMRRIVIDGADKQMRMHRLLLNATDPKIFVDHIDRNGLHNFRSNLRVATCSQNNANRRKKQNGASKYLGVHFEKRNSKWRAAIRKNYKAINLGTFENEIAAAIAYNNAAILIHGEFANLNII